MKTTALDKLIVAVQEAGGRIQKSAHYLVARLNGRAVVVYHDANYRLDFAFEKVAKSAPRPKTLSTVKSVRALLGV